MLFYENKATFATFKKSLCHQIHCLCHSAHIRRFSEDCWKCLLNASPASGLTISLTHPEQLPRKPFNIFFVGLSQVCVFTAVEFYIKSFQVLQWAFYTW
ncbi:hypothetical protein CapIbe_023863 [Capra ibex]